MTTLLKRNVVEVRGRHWATSKARILSFPIIFYSAWISLDGVHRSAALSMSGSSVLVAVNALLLKRLGQPLPKTPGATTARADRPLAPAGNR